MNTGTRADEFTPCCKFYIHRNGWENTYREGYTRFHYCIMCHNPKSEAIVKKSKDLTVKEKANFPFTY